MAEAKKGSGTGTKRQVALLLLATVFLGVALGSFYYIQSTTTRNETWRELSRQIAASVSDLAKAGRGIQPDFALLDGISQDFDALIEDIRKGNEAAGIQPLPAAVQPQVDELDKAWSSMKTAISDIVTSQETFGRMAANIDTLNQTVDGLLAGQTTPEELVLLERIKANNTLILATGQNASVAAAQVKQFASDIERASSNPAIKALAELANTIYKDSGDINRMQQSAATLQGEATNVLAASKSLEQALIDATAGQTRLPLVIYVSGALALLTLVGFVALFLSGVRRSLREAAERDARQQKSILQLLDDITNLADGDLTVDANVTEDFTGAIADSINFTIANLRSLVGTINMTSGQVTDAASTTAELTRQMSLASEKQTQQIVSATTAVTAASRSLQQVAARAESLAEEAAGSVRIAQSGAQTVGRTIQGMTTLREQIQDTAKRIKRLGESTQEIGNIIEFINDIAEQTNTLALNASIQAAMAGDAGRGFAVVADEVQRLAERATSATRQIETLVNTIQADTQEAVTSMERSTSNVVAGAKSAEEAGQALTQIESSSQQLSGLIHEISKDAGQQSASANQIAETMQSVRQIALETADAAAKTSQAVGEMTQLSEKLRESVQGFKLPQDNATPA
jgi:twitching motility protein PilJ